MTARCASRSCSTKRTLPLNSLVTGPTLTLTLPRHVVTLAAGQLRARHQRDHLLQIGEDVPGLLDRRADGELVGDLHAGGPLTVQLYSANASPISGEVVGGLRQRTEAGQTALGAGVDQVGHPERHQRGDPVDGLGDTGRLVEVEISCAADELGGVLDERRRSRRAPCAARSRRPGPAPGSRSSGTGSAGAARRAGRGCGWRSAPTIGGRSATKVPSSGTVTAASPRNSSSSASNSSSARSISSISSTGAPARGSRTHCRIGRSTR